MVTRVLSLAATFILLFLSAVSHAADRLVVEPDRTQLYEGEVLTLTVKGSMKIDINLSNLFSFDLSQLPSPDIEKVEPDFEILARNQRYSVQTVNNEMVGEITWTYQLAPTSTGTLTIPELTFKDSISDPVDIEVISGTPPDQPAASRDSFIELSADKAEVYVQEQLVLTIQLFFSGNLIRGELSEPEHPDAIIESLGKQREFTRYRDGIRYRVVERRYAIFPQTPGTLSLEPIRFEGQARDASGQLRFLRDRQQLYDVPVKPVPAGYPDNQPWLPARSLTLSDEGLPSTQELAVGSNLSRKVTLQALGLPAEALPPISRELPDAIRSYPEQPLRNTETTPEGLRATLQQVTALVPVQAGETTLPALRVPWWNTDTDQLEHAVLPERRFRITGDNATSAPPAQITDDSAGPTGSPVTPETTEGSEPYGNRLWLWATVVFAALWLLTLALWWRARQTSAPGSKEPVDGGIDNEREAFEALQAAVKRGSGETSTLLLRWARLRFPRLSFDSVSDLFKLTEDRALKTAFDRFQAGLYSGQHHTHEENARQQLQQALDSLRRNTAWDNEASSPDLPPLYPASLSR
ncbi:BatD family protein [Marinobacter nauticus]|uniref:BatD family protein n=1 Tax=Marinobacter nauticus TaxID=2743 RepID=UPI000EAB8916|nr:BatD family protein [Marinobacter nauticus]RKR79471.1 oxygen tolerance protein BatD [Marinobacter nauticus]